MPNPHFLLCDSDALIQLFIAKQILLLRSLRKLYGLQSVIVPEVEVEVAWHARFGDRFQQELDKAINEHILARYDVKLIQPLHGAGSSAIDLSIQQLGAEYHKRIGRGEAYTFAAAITLAQPALSHDKQALDILLENGLQVPTTVLRVFDLLGLYYQTHEFSEAECDQVRQAILQHPREFVPRPFRNASFRNGLVNFYPRLHDTANPSVGLPSPVLNQPPYANRIPVSKI